MRHQKQGELKTVPKKPPSDRTHAKGAPPSPEFCILTSGSSPIMKNEPNSSTAALSAICYLLSAAFNKTNPKNNAGRRPATPIFNPHGSGGHASDSEKRNKPNLPHTHPPTNPNMRNKPNSRPFQANHAGRRSVPSIGEPNLSRGRPVEDQICKTKPICPARAFAGGTVPSLFTKIGTFLSKNG